MPTFIPPYLGEEIKSNAEKKMYNILQDLNLKNAYILHSLGLPKNNHKAYGEIDFVIVCEYGVACLEIKGGRVECRDGNWYFTDRYGIERTKHEGPFAQVVGNMYSLDKILKDKFHNSNRLSNITMACGVVFPDIEFKHNGQESISEITFDKSTFDITEYVNNIFRYWEKRKYKDKAKLSVQDVKNVVNFLRGDFVFVPMLSDRLNSVEQKLIRLTYEQTQLMQALSMNVHLMIEGKAGTGKTLLATDYAKKRAKEGKKVLYLTFNKNLSNNVNSQIGEIENLKIINIHALFGEYVKVDNDKLNANPSKYFSEDLPEEVLDYLSVLSDSEIDKNIPYFSTIQGFKGLDSKIVILVDIENIKPENYSRFIYIAGTRARTLLYVVASEEFWGRR